jgi:hypothetical protein
MDTYTKAVLTVIAISLAAIAVENSGVLPAHAYEERAVGNLQGVALCGPVQSGKAWECANIVNGALLVRAQRPAPDGRVAGEPIG